ncbi:hypothetical protein ABZ023_25660 [Streptomyces sp. NPDC006367]|uniref:hypothetical protein n=1 Tax=unclassified Streptomyces TaxID=2593676 RepID=UPI0033B0E16F
MPSRSLPLTVLVLLSVTGCATVTSADRPSDDRPRGVRVPAAQPPSATPTPRPVTPPSQRSTLVRSETDRPHRTPRSDRGPEGRAEASADRTRPTTRPVTRPAPRRTAQPPAKTRRIVPPVRPQPHPEQMRELCRRADGTASADIVDLCHRAWG